MTAHAGGTGIQNLEGHAEFDIVWPWTRPGGLRSGTTAVLRVKNEAPSLPFVLPPLLRACDHVLLVDNGSDDGTAEEALRVADEGGDTTEAHATFDQLREAYVEIYEEAEAISRSTAEHARLQARRRALAEGAAEEPRSLADRVPHDVRAAIPPSVRRGVRKALGRERDGQP